jgi:peptide/nickel transport system substrate-binding protein
MKVYRLLAAILLVVLMTSLIGCTPKAETPAVTEVPPAATDAPVATEEPKPLTAADLPVLVMAMRLDDVVTLDPGYAGETTNLTIHINTYDTLVDYRPDDLTTVVGRLAESWEANEDFTEFTFKLKPDVFFASGNPVTAEDVAFSWMRLINIKGAPAWNLDGVTNVEAIDPLTVKVTCAESNPALVSIAANPSLGIIDSKLAMEHGATAAADADVTDKAKEWLDQNSAGSGPFILKSWTPKSEIVLEANMNYFKGAPKFGKVIIKHVEDPTTQLQMLQTGDADIIGALDSDLYDVAMADPNLVVTVDQTLDENYLAMTSACTTELSPESAALLCDARVRQAVAYAIDYDGLINAVLNGFGTRAPSIIPLGVQGVDETKVWGRDVEKAKALLADAGHADGITLDYYYASNPTRETVAAKIKSDLAEVGITLNLNPMEQSVYLSEMRAQKLPMAQGGWTPDYLDVTMWTDYYALGDRSVAFRMQYANPAARDLALTIRTTTDPAVRVKAVQDLTDILIADMPYTMLWQSQAIHAHSAKITGYMFHPVWLLDFWELAPVE